ncbi:hypothetical protein [Burkholderia cepacia]|uniref:hypothetical protein n=1 Tax=Burkholderia cepacia TaxID=292 RepID=UPI0005A25F93|nr:hypothetical protein [Burkholderia cepacia]
MKHRNDIRFATTGSAPRRAGRMRTPRVHARLATAWCVVARRSPSLRLVVRFAAAPVAIAIAIAIVVAIAAPSVGNHAMAAAAATLACAIAARDGAFAPHCIAHARAAPSMPSPARRRPFSSVRLTLMQDHSS